MNFRKKRGEKGVSPVVGTILLIAITVAIAGVIGYFAMTQQPGEPAPTVSVQFDNVHAGDYTNGGFTITHLGGDKVENDALSVKVDGSSVGFSNTGGENFSVGNVITVDNGSTALSLDPGDKIILSHIPSGSALASTEVD